MICIKTPAHSFSFFFVIFGLLLTNTGYALNSPSSTSAEIIYHTQNEQGDVWVFETPEARYLSFLNPTSLNATQSKVQLSNPDILAYKNTKMILGALYVHPNPQKVVVIGLGGGSIPKALLTLFPHLKLDIVEINSILPTLAEKYFYFKPSSDTRLFIMDAIDFFKQHHEKYDMILLDAFGEDDIPKPLRSIDFTQTLKNSLEHNGIFIVNTHSRSKHYDLNSLPYKQVFGNLITITIPNRIIIGKNGVLPSLDQIHENADHLNTRLSKLGIEKDWLLEKFKIL